jgi:hypothetical protein
MTAIFFRMPEKALGNKSVQEMYLGLPNRYFGLAVVPAAM